jgi:predicted Fe-S protein YdhL (DUF1289 family)
MVRNRNSLSPCVDVCTLDHARNVCTGCLRTIDEIVAWGRFSDDERRWIMADLPNRKKL